MSTSTKRSIEGARRKRQQEAARKRAALIGSRDIGPIPACANPERREACRLNFRLFCETYHAEEFNMGWSEDHLKIIKKVERAALRGGLFAFAMPRGTGKTTICEKAVEWVEIYGHRRFVALIGADKESATEMLDSIKTELETNDDLLVDFPEVCLPIRALEGIPHRAGGQLQEGRRTRIGWTTNEIILPTIRGSKASGCIIRVAGITGRVRGMKFKPPKGPSVRPDMVVIDDPQTDESAASASQNQARAAVISGAILGLAGPGKKIAGFMPCTVIRPGDMADRILDRSRHPEWNGERTKMVYSFPTNKTMWEEYARIRVESLNKHETIIDATEFYRKNRAAMDEGSKVAWEARFDQGELSAIQHAMNEKIRDEAAFFAEYQNEPLPDETFTDDGLSADYITGRVSGTARSQVPPWATRLTAFIDVQQSTLWFTVCAWADDCTGAIIDYGTWPDQKRAYFTLRDVAHPISKVILGAGLEGQIHGALKETEALLMGSKYLMPDGTSMAIERMLVDANWGDSTPTVYEFCRQSTHSAIIMPSHGKYVGASTRPMSEWKKDRGERVGHGWRISATKRQVRHVSYDTNLWKTWIANRLLTAMGDPGALTLFGKDPERHRMIADHCSSEHRVRTTGRGRTVDEWKLKPGQDNHWWDGIVGCAVAASIQGLPIAPPAKGDPPGPGGSRGAPGAKSDRMSFAALQRAAKQRRSA